MSFIAPQFPIYSYTPTLVGTCSVVYGGSGVGSVDLPGDCTGFGYSVTSGVAADGDSVAGQFAAEVSTLCGVTVTASYVWPSGYTGPMVLQFTKPPLSSSLALTFSSEAAARQLGFDSAGPHTFSGTQLTAPHQPYGFWAPKCRGGSMDYRDTLASVGFCEAATNDAAPLAWAWGDTKWASVTVHPNVHAANVTTYAALTTAFVDAALRDPGDRGCILDQFVDWARRSGDAPSRIVRLYQTATLYVETYWHAPPAQTLDIAESVGNNRFYTVTISLRLAEAP